MTNSGFPIERETVPGNKVANEELFLKNTLSITGIDGDGLATNTVTVTTSTPHDLAVGDTITIAGVVTQTDYNLDIGVTVTSITSTTIFEYETTNHIEADADTTGNVRVLDPYSITETNEDLGVFVHLNTGTNLLSVLEITKDGINYVPIGNNDQVIGDVFKSTPMKIGDLINARFIQAFAASARVSYGRLQREQ